MSSAPSCVVFGTNPIASASTRLLAASDDTVIVMDTGNGVVSHANSHATAAA